MITFKDYNNVIELSDLTLEDCINLYENDGLVSVIENGQVVNLVKENA